MAGRAMPTTVASIEAIADPRTVASSTHLPGPLEYRSPAGWLAATCASLTAFASPSAIYAGRPECWGLQSPDLDSPASCATAPVVSSVRLGSTSVARLSASAPGGYLGCGTAITRNPAAAAERSPFAESSTAAHRCGGRPSRPVTAR